MLKQVQHDGVSELRRQLATHQPGEEAFVRGAEIGERDPSNCVPIQLIRAGVSQQGYAQAGKMSRFLNFVRVCSRDDVSGLIFGKPPAQALRSECAEWSRNQIGSEPSSKNHLSNRNCCSAV